MVTETYLVDAVSYTDAEARITELAQSFIRGEFAVKKISQSNVTEIFPADFGEWWYKAKIGIVTIDEKAGREKKVANYFLVAADNIHDALKRLEDGLSYILVPSTVESISLTTVFDVFPYFADSSVPNEIDQAENPQKQTT